MAQGIPQNAQRRMSDRDAASRDTVYHKPAAKAAPAKPKAKSGGGGKKKHGGQYDLKKAPRPAPNVMQTPSSAPGFTPRDSDMRGRPDPLFPPPAGPTSMPGFLSTPTDNFPARPEFPDRSVMQTPSSAPGFLPTPGPTNQPGPEAMGPTVTPSAFPTQSPSNQPNALNVMQTPTSAVGGQGGAVSLTPRVPGPGRAELAGLLAGGSAKGSPPINDPYSLPGEDYLNNLGPDWLRKLFGK